MPHRFANLASSRTLSEDGRMDPKYYGVVEMGFTASIVLGLGLWQLWSVRREQRRDREAAALASSATPPGER